MERVKLVPLVRKLVRVLIPAAGAAMFLVILRVSLDPSLYHHSGRDNWTYPTRTVALFGLFLAAETAALFFVFGLDRPGRVWMRAGGVLILLVPWTVLVSAIVVHAPAFYLLHAFWLWALDGLLSVALLCSALWDLYGSFTDENPGTS